MSHGSVVVAGAGIGGLAAGIGLRRVGFDVRIVERRPQPGVVGAGIALFPNVMRAFDALGVGDAVRAVSARPLQSTAGSGLRLPSGRWLLRTTDPRTADLLACHRNDLYRVLVEALPAEVVEPATEVVDVVPDAAGHGVRVVLHHGGHEGGRDHASGAVDADLLVGADGIDSIVRGRCRPGAAAPRYAGYTAWRGITSIGDWQVPSGETWGRGARFGIVPIGGRRVYWFATDNRPPGTAAGLTGEQRHAEASRLFGRWHAPIPRLLAATDPDDVLQHDIGLLDPPLPSYVSGRVVLLGDAAHAMTPDLGQGACQAVEDAVVLAAELAGSADLPAALARYDAAGRRRRCPSSARSRSSLDNVDWNLRACGRHGHVTYRPDEPDLAARLHVTTPAGEAWRCLRCGTFVPGDPAGGGAADHAPIVLRGAALRDAVVLRLLAAERAVRGLALLAAAYGVYEFRSDQGSLQRVFDSYLPLLQPIADRIGYDLTESGPIRLLREALALRSGTLLWLGIGILLYGALQLTEAVGLWLMRRWGEYVAVVGTSVFLPLEVYELTRAITVTRVGALLINLAAVAYLVWTKRLFGTRGGKAAHEARLHETSIIEVERAALTDH